MRNLLLKACSLLTVLCGSMMLYADNHPYNLQATSAKKLNSISKNEPFIIKDIGVRPIVESNGFKYPIVAFCEYNGVNLAIEASDLRKGARFEINSCTDLMLSAFLQSDAMENLTKNGSQYQLRTELEEEAQEFLYYLNQQNGILSDLYLENYIYSLIYKILPIPFVPMRTGQIHVVIEKNTSLNAGIYPNGTLCITTGLLSALQSEAELVSVLAHEIAHFVLDHCIVNINKDITRKKRAEFWSTIATGAVAAAEVAGSYVAAKKGNYYIPGTATWGAELISMAVAQSVITRLGMKYDLQQETEADRYALQVLKLLGYEKNALATALSRIKDLEVKEGSYSSYFSGNSHAAMFERIMKLGAVTPLFEEDYVKMVSFANSANALLEFERKYFFSAYTMTKMNIDNRVATVDDLVINAACQQMLFNSVESTKDWMALLDKALELSPNNLNALKYKVIGFLKIKNSPQALHILDQYNSRLTQELDSINKYYGQQTWESTFNFLNTEVEWCNNMRLRLNNGYM